MIDAELIPRVAARFKALADEGRLALLSTLQRGEKSVGELAGSMGCNRIPGRTERRNRPAPISVPPVPTPATNAAGVIPWTWSCHQISGPVVASCAAQLSSLANCRGRNAPGVTAASASAFSILPRNPPSAALTR